MSMALTPQAYKQALPKTDVNLKKFHPKHNNDYHPTQTAIKIDELPVPPVLEQVASKEIKFNTDYKKAKHTNITTIYEDN